MRTHIAAALLGSALCLPVAAQTASPEASTAATPEHLLTANVGLFSSYRFRGIDQSFGKPALNGLGDCIGPNLTLAVRCHGPRHGGRHRRATP